jgi:thiol-disulfide isomerase/thioredoxin
MLKILSLCFLLSISSQITLAAPPVFVKNPEEAFMLSEEINADVFLIFTAEWCPSCKVMKNDIYNNLDQFQNSIICYIDYDKYKDMAKQYDVKILPDYRIYRNKVEIKKKIGYKSKNELFDWINDDITDN